MRVQKFDSKVVVRELGILLMLVLLTMASTAGVRLHLLTLGAPHSSDGVTAEIPAVNAFLTGPQPDDMVVGSTNRPLGLALK